MYVRARPGPRPVASLKRATSAREISRLRLRGVDFSPVVATPSMRDVRRGRAFNSFSSVHPGYVLRVEATGYKQGVNGNGERVDLLEKDSEFARLVMTADGGRPIDRLWASALRLQCGSWQPNGEPSGAHLCFLVLD